MMSEKRGSLKYEEGLMTAQLWGDGAEGRVELDVVSTSKCSGVFPLNKDQFLAMKNGDPYRIYYLPRTKKILSVEWLLSDAAREPFVDEQPTAIFTQQAAETPRQR